MEIRVSIQGLGWRALASVVMECGVQLSQGSRISALASKGSWFGFRVQDLLVRGILDFKQVIQFDSPQFFLISYIFAKQTREKILQKKGLYWTVLYHMLSNCSI